MFIQDNEKDHVIIGEAALSLALSEREISVASLLSELGKMAKAGGTTERLNKIADAQRWLGNFSSHGVDTDRVPYLQILAGLNERLN